MPNIKSAEKRNRQSAKNRVRNIQVKKTVKTSAKKVNEAISDKAAKPETISSAFRSFMSTIDTACKKGVIHWKTAARRKSRLAKKVKAVK